MVVNLRCAAFLVLALAAAPVARAQERSAAGRVKIVSGTAFVIHEGQRIPAQVGQSLSETDTLTTGADGRIGVTLRDETRVSLGPNSEVRLDRFVYAPAEGNLAFVMRFVRGIAVYMSGRIAKLSPNAVRLETPVAILGVRGTRIAIKVDAR
jgi:hypothetical protein